MDVMMPLREGYPHDPTVVAGLHREISHARRVTTLLAGATVNGHREMQS